MNTVFLDVAANLIEWLAGDFCHDQDITGLIEGLGVRLSNAGIRVDRLGLHLLLIDPEILGRTLAWSPGERVETVSRLHGFESFMLVNQSPVRHVLETGSWLTLRSDRPEDAHWFMHEVYAGRDLAATLAKSAFTFAAHSGQIPWVKVASVCVQTYCSTVCQ